MGFFVISHRPIAPCTALYHEVNQTTPCPLLDVNRQSRVCFRGGEGWSSFLSPTHRAAPYRSVPYEFQVCFELCNNGANTHFGTEYSKECWCAEGPELTTNGDEVDSDECDMTCAGAPEGGETCGGYDRISAYKVYTTTLHTLPFSEFF